MPKRDLAVTRAHWDDLHRVAIAVCLIEVGCSASDIVCSPSAARYVILVLFERGSFGKPNAQSRSQTAEKGGESCVVSFSSCPVLAAHQLSASGG